MKNRRWYLFVAAVLGILLMSGCGETSERDEGETAAGIGAGPVSFSENGVLRLANGYYLKYHDLEAGKELYLCNKEGCSHQDHSCNAYVGDLSPVLAFFFHDELYIFTCDGETSGMSLWRATKEGTDRKMVISNMPGYTINYMQIAKDTIYYVAPVAAEPEEGAHVAAMRQTDALVAVDMESYTFQVLEEYPETDGEQITGLYMDGQKLFYSICLPDESPTSILYEVTDEAADQDASDLYTQRLKNLHCTYRVVCYDIAANEKQTLLEREPFFLVQPWLAGADSAYGALLVDGDTVYLGERKICDLSETETAYMAEGRIIISDWETGGIRIFDHEAKLLAQAEKLFDEETDATYMGCAAGRLLFSIGEDYGVDIGIVSLSELLQNNNDGRILYGMSAAL